MEPCVSLLNADSIKLDDSSPIIHKFSLILTQLKESIQLIERIETLSRLKLKLESYFHSKDEWWGFKICHMHETQIIAPVK